MWFWAGGTEEKWQWMMPALSAPVCSSSCVPALVQLFLLVCNVYNSLQSECRERCNGQSVSWYWAAAPAVHDEQSVRCPWSVDLWPSGGADISDQWHLISETTWDNDHDTLVVRSITVTPFPPSAKYSFHESVVLYSQSSHSPSYNVQSSSTYQHRFYVRPTQQLGWIWFHLILTLTIILQNMRCCQNWWRIRCKLVRFGGDAW